jgi:hypothetical protein
MNDKNTTHLVSLIASPYYSVRAKAIDDIISNRDSFTMKQLHQLSINNNNDELISILINSYEITLKESQPHTSKLALSFLNVYCFYDNHQIRHKAKRILYRFFHDTDINDNFKKFLIRSCWSNIPITERKYLTRIIGEFKYYELASLLIENFIGSKIELTMETMNVLKTINDRRGNKYIKEIIHLKKGPLQIKAIETLGHIGSFFDGKLIKKLTQDHDYEVKTTSITALRRLLKRRAIPVFLEILNSEETYDIKSIVIKEMGNIHHRKSIAALLHYYNLNHPIHIYTQIEWSIHNISAKKKITTLIRGYYQSDNHAKLKILNILSHFYDRKCQRFYIKILRANEIDTINLTAIEHLARYQTKFAQQAMSKLIDIPFKKYSITAMHSLFKYNHRLRETVMNNWILMNRSVEAYYNHHMIVLHFMPRIRVHNKASAFNYIKNVLDYNDSDLNMLALDCCKRYHDNDLFLFLNRYLKVQDEGLLKDHCLHIMLDIISHYPYYLDENNLNTISKQFLQRIDIKKGSTPLILHMIRLYSLSSNQLLLDSLSNDLQELTFELNTIITSDLSYEEKMSVIKFAIGQKIKLNKLCSQYIIDEIFETLNDVEKELFFMNLFELQDECFLDFITMNLYTLHGDSNNQIKKVFGEYLGGLL